MTQDHYRRAEFEATAYKKCGLDCYDKYQDGEYARYPTYAAWKMWCAAIDAMSKWQPIETAPKDGTLVRLSTTDRLWKFSGNYFDSDGHEKLPELLARFGKRDVYGGKEWMLYQFEQDGEYNSYPYVTNPTHWMPLPAPPQESDDE